MANFNEKYFYERIKLRDAQALAGLDYFRKTFGDDNLSKVQRLTTEYSQAMAQSFFEENKTYFNLTENKVRFFNFMRSIQADKPHSGKRFSEELYKIVYNYINQIEEEKENI